MKCNQCGSENADNSAFCAKCGSPLQPSVATPNPAYQPTAISSGFNNLNAAAPAKKNPAHTILIIECVVGALVLLIIAVLVIWFISSKSGGKEVLSCSKDGRAVTQSVALTYEKNSLSKMEYTYIIDNTIDEDDLRASDEQDLMAAAFAAMAFAQYEGHAGIDYYYSEKSTITTVSLVADLAKMNKSDVEELAEDAKELSIDEAKSKLVGEGLTCTVK